jgi:hypothetical protein
MNNEPLKNSIENLYQVFAKYPLKTKIQGCPHCISDDADDVLHSKPLRKLLPEDLSFYAGKALTTFGDEEDFKHFLPRMFELMSEGKAVCVFGEEILIGKLECANWLEWNTVEQSAVEEFLIELIRYSSDFDEENHYLTKTFLVGVGDVVEDITPYLNLWLENISINKIINLSFMVVDCKYGINGISDTFSKRSPQRKQLETWLVSEKTVLNLENLYFENKEFQNLTELSAILDVIYDLQK